MVQFFILYTQSFMEQNLEMMLLPSSGFNVNGFSAANGVTVSFYFIIFTVISAVMLLTVHEVITDMT